MTRGKFFALFALILVGAIFGSCKSDVDFTPQDQTQRYRITIIPAQHGVISLYSNEAINGEMVKVFVNPDPGYKVRIGSVQYRFPGSSNPAWATMTRNVYYYQVQMGTTSMEVTAAFDPLDAADAGNYTVSVDKNLKNGKIISDTTVGSQGEEVTLYIIPNSGYVLKPNSITVKDAANGTAVSVSVNPIPPHSFPLPAQNIIISAEFETSDFAGMLSNAQNYLKAGEYDTAAEFYTQAYNKRGGAANQNDVNEVLFYYSFVKLGDILLNSTVRSLLGIGSLQMKLVPSTLDDWICDKNVSELYEQKDNLWYATWSGLDYGNDNKGYIVEGNAILWHPRTDLVTEDKVLPRLEERVGIARGNAGNGLGGWGDSFPDTSLVQGANPSSPQKFANLLFWLLLIQNRNAGFNDLLQKIEDRMFGNAFEEAAQIAAQVPDGYQNVPLYDTLKNRFELDKYYGDGASIKVGKAELDYIFGALRMVKAAVQFLRAYDWGIYLQPYLIEELSPGDGLDQILNYVFRLADNNDYYKGYWGNTVTVGRTLPFKNTFLNTRLSENFAKAKNELSTALTMINNSMNYWHGTGSNFSSQGKSNYQWAKTAFTQAKDAMDGRNSGNFNFPKKLPKAGESWPAVGSGDYAVNVTAFFAAGAFNLPNLFTMEPSGVRAPAMFKIPWYTEDYDLTFTLMPNDAARVTTAIPDDDSFTLPGKEKSWYGVYSLQINTGNLRQIFPRGFEQGKYSTTGSTAFLYEVFPTIPLWPERPTYLLGPGSGTKSAQDLYKYFH